MSRHPRLLNPWLENQVDQDTFARKQTEPRDRVGRIKLQLDVLDRSHDETAELAVKVFELSQTLRNQWFSADDAEKRRNLEIVSLNSRLDGEKPCFCLRKPFDVLAEGLVVPESRGSRIRT